MYCSNLETVIPLNGRPVTADAGTAISPTLRRVGGLLGAINKRGVGWFGGFRWFTGLENPILLTTMDHFADLVSPGVAFLGISCNPGLLLGCGPTARGPKEKLVQLIYLD